MDGVQRLDRWDIASLVNELREENPRAFEEEDRYPVLVATTEYRLVWVEGENQEDAVRRFNNDPDWYERLEDPPYNADYEGTTPDRWELHGTAYSDAVGPMNQCTTCGGKQYYVRLGIAHKPDCITLPTTN